MATIFAKPLSVGSGNCLILEPKDVFSQQFVVESGWTELRVGIAASMCMSGPLYAQYSGTTGFNVPPVSENGQAGFSAFFGLRTNQDDFLPNQMVSGYFVGAFNIWPPSTASSLLHYDAGNSILYEQDNATANKRAGIITQANYYSMLSTSNNAAICIQGGNSIGNTGGFASYWGMSLQISDKGKNTQKISIFGFHENNVTPSIAGLRGSMSAFPNSSLLYSGFYTDSFIGTGNPIIDPLKYLYIYCPLYSNRIRIHNWVIEKY